MQIKHETIQGERINTHFGELILDNRGVVINLDDLGIEAEVLLTLPGFLSTDLFPAPEIVEPTTAPEKVGFDEKDYWNVIKELLAAGAPRNNSGYVDQTVLQDALKAKGMKGISGTERKRISDKYAAIEERELAEMKAQMEAEEALDKGTATGDEV